MIDRVTTAPTGWHRAEGLGRGRIDITRVDVQVEPVLRRLLLGLALEGHAYETGRIDVRPVRAPRPPVAAEQRGPEPGEAVGSASRRRSPTVLAWCSAYGSGAGVHVPHAAERTEPAAPAGAERRGRQRAGPSGTAPSSGAPADLRQVREVAARGQIRGVGPAADHDAGQLQTAGAQVPRSVPSCSACRGPAWRHDQHRRAAAAGPRRRACRPPRRTGRAVRPRPRPAPDRARWPAWRRPRRLAAGAPGPARPGARPSPGANGSGYRASSAAVTGTREPRDLGGVPRLVRPYAGLRGLQHGHRPARPRAPPRRRRR